MEEDIRLPENEVIASFRRDSLQRGRSVNEEQRRWINQYERNTGPKKYLRIVAVILLANFIAVAASVLFETYVPMGVYFFILFTFPFVATRWKPTYQILRWVLGNPNLPLEPMPGRWKPSTPRPWWSYLPALWRLALIVLLSILVVRYFTI